MTTTRTSETRTATDGFVGTAGNRFADAVASRRRAPGGTARGAAARLARLVLNLRRHP
ncbi:MAG: peptide transporter permease, partial [Microbacteriaceae bacterium]|nr:peptide transporter permease [Microbacteriaceae bacterium]